jgi:hypothetical protein
MIAALAKFRHQKIANQSKGLPEGRRCHKGRAMKAISRRIRAFSDRGA